MRGLFLTMQAVLLMAFVSDGAGVGRSAPLQPLGDGVREGAALSRSPGGVLAEVQVPDGAGGIFFGADCAGAENIRMKFFSDSKNRRAGLKV